MDKIKAEIKKLFIVKRGAMSLRAMGDMLGVSHTAVDNYEKGDVPSFDALASMVDCEFVALIKSLAIELAFEVIEDRFGVTREESKSWSQNYFRSV